MQKSDELSVLKTQEELGVVAQVCNPGTLGQREVSLLNSRLNTAGTRPNRAVFKKGKRDQLSAMISHSCVNRETGTIL